MRNSGEAHLFVPAAVCLIALCGCSSKPQTTLPAEVTNAVERAVNAGNAKGCAALFSDDAEILSEDAAVVRGKPAIRDFCASQIHPELSLDTTSALSIASGSLAFEQGTYRYRNVRIGANVEFGEYLTVWRHDGAGWKIFRTMYNRTETLPAGVATEPADEPEDRPPRQR